MTPPGTPQAPPRVDDPERYWGEQPPALSDRCTWWVSRFAQGWRPSKRVRQLGYYSSAFEYGVYLWEYLNVIARIEHGLVVDEDDRRHADWSRANPGRCEMCSWGQP